MDCISHPVLCDRDSRHWRFTRLYLSRVRIRAHVLDERVDRILVSRIGWKRDFENALRVCGHSPECSARILNGQPRQSRLTALATPVMIQIVVRAAKNSGSKTSRHTKRTDPSGIGVCTALQIIAHIPE